MTKILRRTVCGLILTITFYAGALNAGAQEAAIDLEAKEVLDGYLKAIGGAEKLEALKSRKLTGTFSIPQAGLKGPISMLFAPPNSMRMEIEIPGIGKVLKICDGKQVYDKNPTAGERFLDGTEKNDALLEANFYSDSRWEELHKTVAYSGRTDVANRPCHKIELETKTGLKRTNYYDVESGLLIQIDATVETPQGKLATKNSLSDYREVDGIKYPHKISTSVMGIDQVVTVEKLEHDVELPKTSFDIPKK